MLENGMVQWVDSLDQGQVEWAWRYLVKQDQILIEKLLNGSPDRTVEAKLRQVLRDFPTERNDTLSRMKKALSQKKYRDKKDKRCSVNYLISKQAKSALDRLAQKTPFTKGDIVSRLLTHSGVEDALKQTDAPVGQKRTRPSDAAEHLISRRAESASAKIHKELESIR